MNRIKTMFNEILFDLTLEYFRLIKLLKMAKYYRILLSELELGSIFALWISERAWKMKIQANGISPNFLNIACKMFVERE